MDIVFFPFKFTTQHVALCHLYKKKNDEWTAKQARGSPTWPRSSIATEEIDTNNMMKA